ncbi:MAG: hypothetical protein K2X27_08740 [Candidatus Obscuribacterales bacterium]|nr:hypothetical protein [Candidatus Obscuribacterales bacterium]
MHKLLKHICLISFSSLALLSGQNAAYADFGTMSPAKNEKQLLNQSRMEAVRNSKQLRTTSPGKSSEPGADHQYGMGLGKVNTVCMDKKVNGPGGGGSGSAGGSGSQMITINALDQFKFPTAPFTIASPNDGSLSGVANAYTDSKLDVQALLNRPEDNYMSAYNDIMSSGGGGSCSGGGCGSGKPGCGFGGQKDTNGAHAIGAGAAAAGGAASGCDTNNQCNKARSDAQGNQCAAAGAAGEDAIQCLINGLDGMTLNLVNVANEDAGAPCASNQISKTYNNAVWMVQRMYKSCFLPMAILFLLPGALITNIKTLVGFGILHNNNDEDAVNPFSGILRSVIAIFLIPMTQCIVSYMVDVGNSLQSSCQPYVSIPLILLWAEEQVQIFKPEQQGNPIKNLPNVPFAPWRGKFAGMPVAGAALEQVSGLDAALSELSNECLHILSEGLTIAYAFQIVMICYLFLLGPLAAAFFAWPSVGRDLFRKAFASWVDGVVILCLWKFWWNIVLICMTVRCEQGALNPFDPFEVYYLIAFLCILMFVPFNPFDFKPGEIVGHAMEKAQAVASKVAQGGKGGGSGGGGGGKGGGSGGAPSPGAQ